MIAGLEKVTAGRIRIGDDDVTTLEPPDRDIAMVFQNYALYPHKTVRENLAFGLRRAGAARTRSRERVDGWPRCSGSSELMDRKPGAALWRPAPARGDRPGPGARAAARS